MPTDTKALRKEAADLLAQAEEMVQHAQDDGRDMSPEEEALFEQLTKQAETIEEHVSAHERAQVLSASKTRVDEIRNRFNQHPVVNDNALTRQQPRSSLRHLWEDDPKKGYRDHRAFLLDVMKAQNTGRESAQLQYLRVRGAAGSDEQSTFADPYGGYLLPEAFQPTLMRVDPEMDPTQGMVTQVPMQVATVHMASRVDKNHSTSVSGGLRVYRRAEADTVTASRMELERITLHANSLMGISYATEELLTDSPLSFVAILQAGFSDEFDSRILQERLNGTGVGEFLGVMQSPALISVTRQTASEIDYLDIVNMMSRCWRYQNAVWIANHDTIPQLAQMNLVVGAGGSAIFVMNAANALPSTLMGKPLFFSEYLQTLGTAGDILLCNWSQYLEGTYQPLSSAESIHVRFVQAERAFRFMIRNDGAPWWRSALTPKNSATTLSPYVTLAA